MLLLNHSSPFIRFPAIGALLSLSTFALLIFRWTHFGSETAASTTSLPGQHGTEQQHERQQRQQQHHKVSANSQSNSTSNWVFDVTRDQDDYGLSPEQCQIAFPKLFVEIDRSVEMRRERPITYKEFETGAKVNDAMVRAMIYQGELYVLNFGDMRYTFSRAKSTLHALNRALMAYPDRRALPNVEFVFTTDDFAEDGAGPIWAYTKRDEDEGVWLMPDFAYWSWPEVRVGSYRAVRRRMAAVDDGETTPNGEFVPGINFQDKKKRLLWRGSLVTGPEVRGKLLEAARGKSWASVHTIDWDDEESIRAQLLPMEEYCRYMFLAHTEGRSFSGRGKYLLNCRSVTVSHKLVWREAHHAALVSHGPEANYVEVERDFSDLEQKIEFLLDHPEVAERIASNAVTTFRDRHLTPAAEACYWRHLIRQYASVCDFEPDLYAVRNGKKELRGVPFENWVLMDDMLVDM